MRIAELMGEVRPAARPPVLCYHRVGGQLELGVTRVAKSVFARQMTTLARAGWKTLTLDQFAERLQPGCSTFLITDYVGRLNTWDVRYTWHRLAHLDWDTIGRWQARGFDFASHTASHQRLTWLSDGQAAAELERSRDTLRHRLGLEAAQAVAYPFGARDERIERLAGAAGYELGFGGVRGNGSR